MKNERGSALLSVLVFATVVAVLSIPLFNSVLQDRMVLAIENDKTQNHYALESVIEIIKAADVQNASALDTFVTNLNNKNAFINENLRVPVKVDMDLANRELTIETDGDRKISNLKGQFHFINADVFLSNLFVTKRNGKTPAQNVGLTPNCGDCTANHFRSNIRDYFSDIDPLLFDHMYQELKATVSAPAISNQCLSVGTTEYSHLKCSSINNPAFPTTANLKINGDAFVAGDFNLQNIESITIDGDLVVGGNIHFSNVKKVTVNGIVIANGKIAIRNPGGGNSNTSGVIIDVKGMISGSTENSNNIIDIHVHGLSDIFQRYINPSHPLYNQTLTEGTFLITDWDVKGTN